MNNKVVVLLSFLILLSLGACDKSVPDPVFNISGSPNPLMTGPCFVNNLTIEVTGPGDNLIIDSIIASYNLFDGSGTKVKTGSISLKPSPGDPPVTYVGTVALPITSSPSSGGAPDSSIVDFNGGRVEFGAFVDAKFITHPDSGPFKPVGHTKVESIPIVACSPTPTAPPLLKVTIVPPHIEGATVIPPGGSGNKPKPGDAGGPSGPPSCSTDPNNPSCVP